MWYLKNKGIQEGTKTSLHFLFVNSSNCKSPAFEDALNKNPDYLNIKSFSSGSELFIAGQTTKQSLDEDSILTFKNEMETLGKKYEFEFLGWGTDI